MQLSQSVSILEQENNRLNQENAELRRLLGTEGLSVLQILSPALHLRRR